MNEPDRDLSQQQADDLCRAASAVYYRVVQAHAMRTGRPALLPELLCPRGCPPCVHQFDESLLNEAEQMLLRLGVIADWPSS